MAISDATCMFYQRSTCMYYGHKPQYLCGRAMATRFQDPLLDYVVIATSDSRTCLEIYFAENRVEIATEVSFLR